MHGCVFFSLTSPRPWPTATPSARCRAPWRRQLQRRRDSTKNAALPRSNLRPNNPPVPFPPRGFPPLCAGEVPLLSRPNGAEERVWRALTPVIACFWPSAALYILGTTTNDLLLLYARSGTLQAHCGRWHNFRHPSLHLVTANTRLHSCLVAWRVLQVPVIARCFSQGRVARHHRRYTYLPGAHFPPHPPFATCACASASAGGCGACWQGRREHSPKSRSRHTKRECSWMEEACKDVGVASAVCLFPHPQTPISTRYALPGSKGARLWRSRQTMPRLSGSALGFVPVSLGRCPGQKKPPAFAAHSMGVVAASTGIAAFLTGYRRSK